MSKNITISRESFAASPSVQAFIDRTELETLDEKPGISALDLALYQSGDANKARPQDAYLILACRLPSEILEVKEALASAYVKEGEAMPRHAVTPAAQAALGERFLARGEWSLALRYFGTDDVSRRRVFEAMLAQPLTTQDLAYVAGAVPSGVPAWLVLDRLLELEETMWNADERSASGARAVAPRASDLARAIELVPRKVMLDQPTQARLERAVSRLPLMQHFISNVEAHAIKRYDAAHPEEALAEELSRVMDEPGRYFDSFRCTQERVELTPGGEGGYQPIFKARDQMIAYIREYARALTPEQRDDAAAHYNAYPMKPLSIDVKDRDGDDDSYHLGLDAVYPNDRKMPKLPRVTGATLEQDLIDYVSQQTAQFAQWIESPEGRDEGEIEIEKVSFQMRLPNVSGKVRAHQFTDFSGEVEFRPDFRWAFPIR